MISVWWVLGAVLLERLFELWLARRNLARALARGGREWHPAATRRLLAMHVAFFAALVLESYPWQVPLDTLTVAALSGIVGTMLLRYWCILTLGDAWNTRIVTVPGMELVQRGPYRLLRHPNYLAVTLELALLPLLCRAPLTLVVFALANLLLLRQRIALEEAALHESTRRD